MKRLAVVLVLVLAPLSVMAGWADVVGDILEGVAESSGDGHNNSSRPGGHRGHGGHGGYDDLSCRASDTGWEEHWGGHRDCDECLEHHGSCVEVCTATTYACDAQGIDRDGNAQIVRGRSEGSRRDAMNEALDECEFRGLRQCETQNCNSSRETVSRRTCRERR